MKQESLASGSVDVGDHRQVIGDDARLSIDEAPNPLKTPDITVWCENHKEPIDAEPGLSAGADLTRTTKWSQPEAHSQPSASNPSERFKRFGACRMGFQPYLGGDQIAVRDCLIAGVVTSTDS